MPDSVRLTIDGKLVEAARGTLVIDAAKRAGIEIPAFCYYEGLSLQAACRMCLVEVEKMPKMMTACTLPASEGMVVRTDTEQVRQSRKYMLEFLLTNHPLDCPVCDKGGECELQDMAFRYGVGESRYTEEKVHTPEKQFSPVVFFDAPRCILCFRCVRICNEGLGVNALGVINRGVVSEIAPNHGDHLECDECGACIDICPVGALTSGIYRYHTRPWEMTHVGTICTHCADDYSAGHFPADFGGAHRFFTWLLVDFVHVFMGRDTRFVLFTGQKSYSKTCSIFPPSFRDYKRVYFTPLSHRVPFDLIPE